ncbi:alpha-L-rhamnosidase, partial [Kouleothrix aurantiaca]
CPQRDERLGWTGDIQVFAPTASFLFDTAGFLQSWLADLAAEQAEADGVVPFVVPNVLPGTPIPAAAWGDAAAVVPWVLYQRFGDTGILETQFDSMRAWVDLLAKIASERHLWDRGFQFGDWLDPSAPPDKPADARTSPQIVATAYFARSAELVAEAAAVLGRVDDATHYHALAAKVRDAFAREYVTSAGRLLSDAATAYALAIGFGLLRDGDQRRNAGRRLAALVRDSRYRISTGFVGTPLICDALCSVGEYDTAFRLLLERENPSWLYPVTMGATTIWERWDSMLPDGSINPGEMTSFNHYALGAVADWIHRMIGGLTPAAPGYRAIEIHPVPGGGITQATTRHQTPYGLAECTWAIEAEEFRVTVVVPPNTMARVFLPGSDAAPVEVGSGTHQWSCPYQKPQTARSPLSLDSTLGEIIGDPEVWTTVLSTIARHMPVLSEQMNAGTGISGNTGLTLRQAVSMRANSDTLRAELETALTQLKH